MSFSVKDKELVRSSFAAINQMSEPVALLFYGRLFELAPGARQMFSPDLREQSRKLMDMLQIITVALDDMETIRPQIEELGRRHVSYGVQPKHYLTLVDALLWTFSQALESNFDAGTRAAWLGVLGHINQIMIPNENGPRIAGPVSPTEAT